jgi:lipoprotein-releasing system ATP-binding protein
MSQTLLRLDHVRKTYPQGEGTAPVDVLRDVSFSLRTGESAALVGPSGCGKSTLLNIAGLLDRPDGGTVILAGKNGANLTVAETARLRARTLGFIFQLHHLLPQLTALENVLLPTLPLNLDSTRSAAARERAERLLTDVGLARRLDHFPGALSVGERQRVAVARGLINSPSLLLADEPTGALDERRAAELVDLLLDLSRRGGMALLMVTHDRRLAGRLDTLRRLHEGRIEDGRIS